MPVRDHEGIVIDKFNGLWQRGNPDNTPLDHFSACNNVDYVGDQGFQTRPGIGLSQQVAVPLSNVKRIYNYPTQNANTLLVLTYSKSTGNGTIYHVVSPGLTYGPILTVAGMTDFAFVPYAGRAFISPFSDYVNGDLIMQQGLSGQFVYIYNGDGTAARKAAGAGMTGTMTVTQGAPGNVDFGQKVFGFVSQTSSGYNSPPSILTPFLVTEGNTISFGNIPTSGDPNVVKRLLVSTKTIPGPFNGDLTGNQLFFVPNAVINDNTSTSLNNVAFYDADLLSDASHLLNNFTSIAAGAALNLYHNRLCVSASFGNISLMYLSAVGEPEAIDQVNNLIVVPLDGNPITNAQEMRDVLYIFKRSRTASYTDNGGNPATWPLVWVDNALGTSPHGIATVLDSGSASVDYLIVATYNGISVFNGKYMIPELSWKIEDYWRNQDFSNNFGRIQIVNSPLAKKLMCVTPGRVLLVGNYSNGFDVKNIRWAPWSFKQLVNTVAIQNINNFILGSDLQ